MPEYKISVIIPVYNVEKYLRQCLDSVIHQTLKEIEIIIVNDGSTDSSLSIIQEYAAGDPRIVIIDKPNGGYGESMNQGFDKANGEYLGIIESDDYAEPDMFEKLYSAAKLHQLDVVKSGFFFYWSGNGEKNVPRPIASKATSGRTFCPAADFKAPVEMVEFFNLKPTIWSAIYRRDFIRENNIRFHETPGASYQDTSFNFKVWCCAQRVRLMEDCFLHYRQDNENSSINSPGKVYCVCDEYEEIFRFLSQRPCEEGKLAPVVARIQFDSYNWNYERLRGNEKLQREFSQRFYHDFMMHEANGLLQREYFDSNKWKYVQILLQGCEEFHKCRVCERYGLLYEAPSKPQTALSARRPSDPSFPPQPEDPAAETRLQWIVRNIKILHASINRFGLRHTIKSYTAKIQRRLHK